jgi:16S rRNA (guanine966-N2)-methyltransferase
MRIIAGEARGRPLVAPIGTETRPTRDMVREALFDILAGYVEGARILDGFAGSGALALEALSRGALHATLIENAPKALAAIRRNIRELRMSDRTLVLPMDFERAARKLQGERARFDIMLLDPPYRMEPGKQADMLAELCAPGAMIALEHARAVSPIVSPPLILVKSRAYGDTALSFYIREESA